MATGGTAPDKPPDGEVPPKRMQLSRAKGWRMPPNTVKVDRTTRWGNPFRDYPSRRAQAERFKASLVQAPRPHPESYMGRVLDDLHELRGKNLACWCPLDQPCHADVLLELANADSGEEPPSRRVA
jgi:hypothetical protein